MAQTVNFSIDQGTDSRISFLVKDCSGSEADFSGYDALMQVKESAYSKPVDTLSTGNGRITLSSEGLITLRFPHDDTAWYPASSLLYDLSVMSSDRLVFRIVTGKITVQKRITKP